MRRAAAWAWRHLLAGLLLLAAGAGLARAADAQVQEIGQAQLTLDEAAGPGRTVALPYGWDREQGARAGTAHFRIEFALGDAPGPWALFVPRLGNTYRITLNGLEVASFGGAALDPGRDATQQPRFFELHGALPGANNTLEITIAAPRARGAGLSPLVVGPRDAVRARYERLYLCQRSGSRVVAIVSAVLGLLALLLWLRRRDPVFLYYGAGELAWSIQTARVLFDESPVGWPWIGLFVTTAFHLAAPLLCKFALAVVGRTSGWLWRAMTVLVWLAFPAAALWLLAGWLWVGPAWQTLGACAVLALAVVIVRATWRTRLWEERVLCAAVLLIVVAAVRDVTVLRLSAHAFEVVPWIRFAWLGFGVAMAWVIAERMRKDSQALATLNATLQLQLQELLERERDTQKRSGALEERQRLVRDLHDGLGGHLVGTLRLAQRDDVPREALTRHLRDAIDQLRITVDSMHDAEGDVAAALATVRYRLAPRLQAAGIELHWQVDPLPPVAAWGVREAHHLQMLLYEAFSNMIQHSGATQATLAAREHAGGLAITLADNGRGFDAAAAGRGGKGLDNMRKRARTLGSELHIEAGASGTVLSLLLRPGPGS
jgi:signal transduction histidine kinase